MTASIGGGNYGGFNTEPKDEKDYHVFNNHWLKSIKYCFTN
jgi:hypothetical protein